MSHFDHQVSKSLATLVNSSTPFASLIMAAMRQADDINLRRLQKSWPDIWMELQERYNAHGGLLPSDSEG